MGKTFTDFMRKSWKVVAVFAVAFVTGGCLSVDYRLCGREKIDRTYKVTRAYWSACTFPFGRRLLGAGELEMACTYMLPFAVIEMPLDVVIDTACLPVDLTLAVSRED